MVDSVVVQVNPIVDGEKLLKVSISDDIVVALSANGDFKVHNLDRLVKNAHIVGIRSKAGFDVAGTVTAYAIEAVLRDVTNTLNSAAATLGNFATNGTGVGKTSSSIVGALSTTLGPTTTSAGFDNDKQYAIVLRLTGYTGTGNVTLNTAGVEVILAVDG